ncbi:MAG: caspase family protein, partial [Candidatus Parabeggiatoa sp.]|nr:caspase family protein [Candidatus Parabeggiatoa sp.]
VKADQLHEYLYRPDVINAAIRLRSVDKAIAQTGAHFNLARLQRELPPRFQIVSPRKGSKMEKGVASVVLNLAENTLAIQMLAVYVNGRQVTPQKVRKINPIITQHKRTLEVPLEKGENRISIRATNSLGSTSAEVTVFYDGESQIREGTLHLVSIGVSAYPNLSEKEQLDFAAIDAQAIYNKLIATAQKQYRDVNGVLISDNQGKTPNKSNIETALQALNPKKEDTTILFLAGHGINLDGEYFFMPKGSKRQGSELNKNSLVRWKILQDAIAKSQGRRILLVDTCHAGKAFNPRLVKDSANKNIFVLSATDAENVSQEMKNFGHGVFTYALLEGLKGEANIIKFDGGKKIMFSELNTYVTGMVKHLTKNRQIPVSQASSDGFMDFVFVQL